MENSFTIIEQKVIRVFFDHPTQHFRIRAVARLIGITHPTVKKAIEKLCTIGIVTAHVQPGLSSHALKRLRTKGMIQSRKQSKSSPQSSEIFWKANMGDERYYTQKKLDNLKRIYASGLIDHLAQKASPNAIILFGSYSKGDDIESSDVDLFVVSEEQEMNLRKYENMLCRKINITFEEHPLTLRNEFLNNLINGTVLYGYFEAIQ